MTSLPCSSRSKRVQTKISILEVSFIGHLECPGISEAFLFDDNLSYSIRKVTIN